MATEYSVPTFMFGEAYDKSEPYDHLVARASQNSLSHMLAVKTVTKADILECMITTTNSLVGQLCVAVVLYT